MTVAEIRQLVRDSASSGLAAEELLRALSCDPRAGVRNMAGMLEKQRRLFLEEQKRLENLYLYEDRLAALGMEAVAGVDEAGRGPLAGPVAAAAVILPRGARIHELNDSKRLSPAKRKALALEIKKISKAWAVGMSTVEEIQELNVHRASMLAMRRALEGLETEPGHVLVDGFAIPDLGFPQTAIVGGDGKSASIAAASILAKVARDDLMELAHFLYPEYGFDRHKGYPTPDHVEALRRYGPCPLHRQGFGPVREFGGAGG
ncbi:MAG: ribonuclease HII [Peptococcaceae bacterium]|nr:ribonuclease HII [Peptococcaceae bacterium]